MVTAISRLSGFGREAVIAAVYGASRELDAYLVATGIPNVVIALLSTVAVTAFIPKVADRVRSGDASEGHRLFRTLTVAVLVALGAGSVLMAVFAPAVVAVMAPGFDGAQQALTVALTRVLLVATVFVAGMNLISGLLNVHRRFFWPAFVGIPFNLAMVVAALAFGRRFGVAALAWGFVAGSLLRVVVQLPALRRTGFRWLNRIDWRDAGLRAVAGLFPVIVLSHVTGNVNSLVDRIVGSGLESGAISSLHYAYRLVALPHGLFVIALLQVVYPALGASGGAGRRQEFRSLVTHGAGALTVLLVPVGTALIVLAQPIIEVVYARGSFGADATALTATALVAYSPGLVALGLRDLGVRALYGLSDTRTPVIAALAAMVVNVIGDVTLGPAFGVAGLGAATSLSFAAGAAVVLAGLVRRHRVLRAGDVIPGLVRGLAIAPVSGLVMAATYAVPATGGSTLATGAALALAAGVGFAAHVLLLRLLRAPDAQEFLRAAGQIWRATRTRYPRRRT